MPVGTITPLEVQLEKTPGQLRAENLRLKVAMHDAVIRLADIDGDPDQDVESLVAKAREILEGALDMAPAIGTAV